MIKTNIAPSECHYSDYKYNFTPEEKARIVRRTKESREIRNEIKEWYISYFQDIPSIHRWTKKFGNRTIIGYGLFGNHTTLEFGGLTRSNKKLSEKLNTLTDEELEKELTTIYNNFKVDKPFRIKACFDDEYGWYSIRFIFAEENELPVEPLGKKIDIVHWKKGDEEFHGAVLDDELLF